MGRISDEEIARLWRIWRVTDCPDEASAEQIAVERLRKIAQAQLESYEAEIRKLFEEMDYYERKPEQFDPLHPFLRTGDIYIIPAEYQALKERWIK